MTLAYILDYLPRKMKRIGIEDYETHYHVQMVPPLYTIEMEAANRWVFIPSDSFPSGIRVKSQMGIAEKGNTTTILQLYEHSGRVTIENTTGTAIECPFLFAVPIRKRRQQP